MKTQLPQASLASSEIITVTDNRALSVRTTTKPIDVLKFVEEINALDTERFNLMMGGLSNGRLTSSAYAKAKDVADRLDRIIAGLPSVTVELNGLQRKATDKEIGKALIELAESRSNGGAKRGGLYGRIMIEEVVSDAPSIGALQAGVRLLWRSQRADSRPPEIGDVLDAIQAQERIIALRVRMIEVLPTAADKLKNLIADYEKMFLSAPISGER